jgi:hypothetical protein
MIVETMIDQSGRDGKEKDNHMGYFANRRDRNLRDFGYMSGPINHMYRAFGWAKTHEEVDQTVINRLCNLIWRVEREPHPVTVAASKFYDANFALIPITLRYTPYINGLRIRLRTAIGVYEGRHGEVDPYDFTQLVGPSDREKQVFLWGPSFVFGSNVAGNPGTLAFVIHQYCWYSSPEY